DITIVRLVAARTGADVDERARVAERGVDLGGDARVGSARTRVRHADPVVAGRRHGNFANGRRRSNDTISIAVSAASSPLWPSDLRPVTSRLKLAATIANPLPVASRSPSSAAYVPTTRLRALGDPRSRAGDRAWIAWRGGRRCSRRSEQSGGGPARRSPTRNR